MRFTRSSTLRAAFAAATLLLPVAALAAEERTIPSSRCRGLFIVPVTWNGATVDLVLDTGAESSSIDPDAVRRAFGRSVRPGKSVTLRDGQAGPLRLDRVKAQVHEMDHLAFAIGQPIDGILGFDVFKRLLLTLDYPGSRITVSDGALPPVDRSRVFPSIGKRRPFIALELGERSVPLLIDSGSTGGISLDRDDPLDWESEPRPISASVRYSGTVIQSAGRLAGRLEVGPLTLERPVVRLSSGKRLLGAEVLGRSALTFDQRNRRLRIASDTDEAILFKPVRGTGFALRPRGTVAEVIDVFPGSPAESAGVRTGDLLTTIDGTPVAERGCVSLADENARSFGFERDGARFEIAIEPMVLVP